MIIIVLFVVLFSTNFAFSQENDFDYLIYQDHKFENDTLKIYCDNANISIVSFTPNIVKISLHTDLKFTLDSSYTVLANPIPTKVSINEQSDFVDYMTNKLKIRINKNPLKIQFFSEDSLLLEENTGFFKKYDYRGIRFKISDNEEFYGSGIRAVDLNRNGKILNNFNQNIYSYKPGADWLSHCVPLIMSNKKYAVFYDNHSFAYNDLGFYDKNLWQYNSNGGTFSYFFMIGKNYFELLNYYYDLTGKHTIPPRWSFGYLQSRYTYSNQEEFLDIFNRMKNENFPVESYIFDLTWFGFSDDMGNFTWDKTRWSDPQSMINLMLENHIKPVLISEPFLSVKGENFQYAKNNDLLTKKPNGDPFITNIIYFDQGLIDYYKPEARKWIFQFYKKLKDSGIKGWWLDMGEPDAYSVEINYVVGNDYQHHNMYCSQWMDAMVDGYKNFYPDERPFLMSRAGYAGTQRYGAVYQSGDNHRSWDMMKTQSNLILGGSYSGISYIHSDISGFSGTTPADPVMYTKWLQFGTFNPVMRAHMAIPAASEPIFYPDSLKAVIRKFIKLRFSLLPYNYNLAFENMAYGKPLSIPYNFYYEPELFKNSEQYFWGENIMVVPDYDSVLNSKQIEIPKGIWLDFWTNEKIGNVESKSIINRQSVIENIGIFIKAGSIVPFAVNIENTSDFKYDTLQINYYSDYSVSESSYTLFEDDGITTDTYSKGDFIFSNFKINYNKDKLVLNLDTNGKGYFNCPDYKYIIFKSIKIDFEPDSIVYNGTSIPKVEDFEIFDNTEICSIYRDGIFTVKLLWDLNKSKLEIYNTRKPNSVDKLKEVNKIVVYPNPSRETFRIQINSNNVEKVEIFDINGKYITNLYNYSFNNEMKEYLWNPADDVQNGIYILKISNPDKIYVNKLILMRD